MSCLSSLPLDKTIVAEVDLATIVQNYKKFSNKFTGSSCAAVLKSDAYGLGANEIGLALAKAGCRNFFVANLEEGISLRKTVKNACIYILNGFLPNTANLLFESNLIPVLISLEQVKEWQSLSQKKENRLPAILHIDTGMCRTGLSKEEFELLIQEKHRWDGIDIHYVMSHLSCAKNPDSNFNSTQLKRFVERKTLLPSLPASFVNSYGVFLGNKYHFDLARIGIGLYGMIPEFSETKQSVRLWARVLQVSNFDSENSVGYDATYQLKKNSRLAVLSSGYACGIPVEFTNTRTVTIDRYSAPVVGRVSMELTVIDVTSIPLSKVFPGSWVDVTGNKNLFVYNDVSAYEFLTNLRCISKVYREK